MLPQRRICRRITVNIRNTANRCRRKKAKKLMNSSAGQMDLFTPDRARFGVKSGIGFTELLIRRYGRV